MRRIFFIFSFISALFSLKADTFTLTNGNKIRGEVVGESVRTIRINVGCGLTQMISKAEIAYRKKEKLDETLLYLGKKELKRNQLGRAIKTFKRGLTAGPNNQKLKNALAQGYIQKSSYEEKRKYPQAALQALLDAKQLTPTDESLLTLITKAKANIKLLDDLEQDARKCHVQGQFEKAVDLFDKLIKKDFSRNSRITESFSESLVALGDGKLSKQQWLEASSYYDRSLVQNPDLIVSIEDRWASSHLNPVANEINNRNYEYALQEIKKVLEIAPDNDNALYLLGVTYRNMRKNDLARKVFNKILINHKESPRKNNKELNIKELTEKAKKHFKTEFTLLSLNEAKKELLKSLPGDWKIVEGKNWKLYHHSHYFADQIKLVMNDLLLRVSKDIGGSKLPKMQPILELYLYRNFKEYKEGSKAQGWSAGVTQTLEINGTINSRRILSYQSPQFMQSTLPHELGHVILPLLINKNPSKIPHWLNEGMAVRLEPKYKTDYYRNLIEQEKASGKKLPLKTILEADHYPGDEDTVKLYYAKCYALVDYMVQDMGQKDFLEWAKKVDHDNCVTQVKKIYHDLDKLENKIYGE